MTLFDPLIAISLGDVNGIGPEVAIHAAQAEQARARFILIGSTEIVSQVADGEEFPAWSSSNEARLSILEPEGTPSLTYQPGIICKDAARASLCWIEAGIEGCLSGSFDGLVTAPICKEGWQRAGINYPGHTELIAERTGAQSFAMVLAGKGLQVALVTRHIALRDVPDALTEEAIVETICLTAALSDHRPIAVCGLNPHAGDGGMMGDEEERVINPAIKRCEALGHHVIGPVPADTVFHQAVQGKYSAVVAMYHDQGLGPLKMHAFDEGVNITLGLPIVRTSPDHGTAYDIAGKGIANSSSMRAAIAKAIELSRPGGEH